MKTIVALFLVLAFFSVGEIVSCVCTEDFNPVCGSDGRTYGNACQAGCAGVTYYAGKCSPASAPTVAPSFSCSQSSDCVVGVVGNVCSCVSKNQFGSSSLQAICVVENGVKCSCFENECVQKPILSKTVPVPYPAGVTPTSMPFPSVAPSAKPTLVRTAIPSVAVKPCVTPLRQVSPTSTTVVPSLNSVQLSQLAAQYLQRLEELKRRGINVSSPDASLKQASVFIQQNKLVEANETLSGVKTFISQVTPVEKPFDFTVIAAVLVAAVLIGFFLLGKKPGQGIR